MAKRPKESAKKRVGKIAIVKAVTYTGRGSSIHPLAPWENAIKPPSVNEDRTLEIVTAEGVLVAQVGDWVVKDAKGNIYPVSPADFDRDYELREA